MIDTKHIEYETWETVKMVRASIDRVLAGNIKGFNDNAAAQNEKLDHETERNARKG